MSAFRLNRGGNQSLPEIPSLTPQQRAARCRELAREARKQAANSKGEVQAAFTKFAEKWEQIAREAETETESEE